MLWASDWGWGVFAVVLTVAFHVFALFGLGATVFNDTIIQIRARSTAISLVVFALLTMEAILLPVIEAAGWGFMYLRLGAATNFPDAYLHSLGAFSTMGDATVVFDTKWRLLLQIEALNAIVCLGLTTAFLFTAAHALHKFAESAKSKFLAE
jgi:hypothetical protein